MLYLTVILPQGIFYVLSFIILGCWCLKQENIDCSIKYKKVEKLKNMYEDIFKALSYDLKLRSLAGFYIRDWLSVPL